MHLKKPPNNLIFDFNTQSTSRKSFFKVKQRNKMGSFNARQVEKILKKHGFVFEGQSGSHRKWRNPVPKIEDKKNVFVPYHGSKTLKPGTLRQIIRASGIPKSEWRL